MTAPCISQVPVLATSAAVAVHTHVPAFIDDAAHATDARLEQLLDHAMQSLARERAQLPPEVWLVARGRPSTSVAADTAPVKGASWVTRAIHRLLPNTRRCGLSAANDFSLQQAG